MGGGAKANQDHVTRQQMSSSGVRLQTSGRHTASLQTSAIQASSFQTSDLPTSRKDKTKGSCHGRQSWQNDAHTEDRVKTISSEAGVRELSQEVLGNIRLGQI